MDPLALLPHITVIDSPRAQRRRARRAARREAEARLGALLVAMEAADALPASAYVTTTSTGNGTELFHYILAVAFPPHETACGLAALRLRLMDVVRVVCFDVRGDRAGGHLTAYIRAADAPKAAI